MLRTGATRSVLRSLNASQPVHPSFQISVQTRQIRSQLCTLSSRRPQTIANAIPKPTTTSILRRQVSHSRPLLQLSKYDKPDTEHERKVAEQKLKATPDTVSTTSSIHPVMGEVGVHDPEDKPEVSGGIKADLETIKDTFSLNEVPREAYYIGMAGVLPYLATSLSTVYCAWEIQHAAAAGTGLLMSGKSAELLLHVLEPLQVGYGAVIISFLGAIHWGLEWAGYGGYHSYRRYAIGVVAPAVAWPTILLSPEKALIAQFCAFTFLYYADSRATKRGWTPPWYNTYRFVLTFVVGASIVISLIGRGQIAGQVGQMPSATARIQAFRENSEEELAKEEAARRQRIVEQDEQGKTGEKEEEGEEDEEEE